MTNLLEKSLLTGFGVFLLIIFISLVLPLMKSLDDYNIRYSNNLDEITAIINDIDNAIIYIIDHPEENYIKQVYYPKDLNITIEGKYIKYFFRLEGLIYTKILYYEEQLLNTNLNEITPGLYKIVVNYQFNSINIQLIENN